MIQHNEEFYSIMWIVSQCFSLPLILSVGCADGAMEVKFTPNKPSLVAGDELRCSARGNPVPEIQLSPAALLKKEKSGSGWRSLVVQREWVGRTLTVECTATNRVDGVVSSPSHGVTFNVTGDLPTHTCLQFTWIGSWSR